LDILKEMEKFLEIYTLPILNKENGKLEKPDYHPRN